MANKIASRKFLHTISSSITADGYCPPRSKIESYGGIKVTGNYAQNRLVLESQCSKASTTLTLKYVPILVPDLIVSCYDVNLNSTPIQMANDFTVTITHEPSEWARIAQEISDSTGFDTSHYTAVEFKSNSGPQYSNFDFDSGWDGVSQEIMDGFDLGPAIQKLIDGQSTTVEYPSATFRYTDSNGGTIGVIGLDIEIQLNSGRCLLWTKAKIMNKIIVPSLGKLFVKGNGRIGKSLYTVSDEGLIIAESGDIVKPFQPPTEYGFNNDNGVNKIYDVSKKPEFNPGGGGGDKPDPHIPTMHAPIRVLQESTNLPGLGIVDVQIDFIGDCDVNPKYILWNRNEIGINKSVEYSESDSGKSFTFPLTVRIKDSRTGHPNFLVKYGVTCGDVILERKISIVEQEYDTFEGNIPIRFDVEGGITIPIKIGLLKF